MKTSARSLVVLASLMVLSACNSGVFGVWSATSDSSTNSVPTTVSDVTVSDSVNSPATISFTLTGPAASAVQLEYLPPGVGTYVPIATLGAGDVSSSSTGEVNQYDWDFAAGLGTDYVDGLAVRVRLADGASATTSASFSVGNSPPVIAPFSFPANEVAGVVGVLFTVADTDDTVSLAVEVNPDAENGFPEGSWETALPDLGEVLVPFVAVESGTTVSFHWDVVGQYGSLDSEVMVRATAVDTADPGAVPLQDQVEGGTSLRVDNNAPPVVTLGVSSFTSSPDKRRGIIVPYTLNDAEGDTADLVFQWTLEGDAFVDLPGDEASIETILSDAGLREHYRIATPYPLPINGHALPGGAANSVELPELGSSQSHLLQHAEQPDGDLGRAFDGYELELLRSSKIPEPLSASWLANLLDGPVAALPASESTTAYVLDGAGSTWRLREIDLATGTVVRDLATGTGTPDALAAERGGAALLVAAHDFNLRVSRVDLDTLAVLSIFDAPGTLPSDTIRGLASVGSKAALATVGDELLRLNYSDPLATTSSTALNGLATPWGIAVDPLRTSRVYLAERDFAGVGRVLTLDLDTLAVDTLQVAPPGLPHPESLAIESGGRLLVLTDVAPGDGTKELRGLEPGSSLVSVLTTELPESAASLAVGADDLRLLALMSGNDLAVGGGVAQLRTIVDYDPTRRVATVDAAFAPPLTTASAAYRWRVQMPARLALEAGVTRRAAFLWDSRDLPGGEGKALLRVTARDADESVFEHDGGKQILSGLAGQPSSLGDPGATTQFLDVEAADLDGDGDLDLVFANSVAGSTLEVFFQTGVGVFDPVPLSLGGPGTTDFPQSVAAADLDGDGDLDLVSANTGTPLDDMDGSITVFFQTAAGVFDPVPLSLGGAGTSVGASAVEVADLDGDGDLDLVSANQFASTLTVFFQTGAGVFDPVPSLTLGGPVTTPGFTNSLAAADLDGDGDLDLVSTSNFALNVFFQTGTGVFDPVPSLILDSVFFPTFVEATDVDGDGDVDIFAANGADSTLKVFFQEGAGVFDRVPSLILGNPQETSFPQAVAAADMDGDGDLDLVLASAGSDTINVFAQRAAGVFDPVPSLTLGGPQTTDGAWRMAVADLDGNGAVDIVSANQFTDVAVFLQSGAGDFDSEPSLILVGGAATGFPAGVEAADLDGDGDTDIVSANSGVALANGSVTVFFQAQAGVFDPVPSLTLGGEETTQGAVDVTAADLDGDGDADIVSANGYDLFVGVGGTPKGQEPETSMGLDTLTVFFQTGAGVFDPEPSLTLGGPSTTDGVSSVEAADLDGDGDLDLVSANARSDTLTVFFQTGSGVFDTAPSLTLGGSGTTDGPFDVAVADLDGDGDLDLVSANGFDVFMDDVIVDPGSDTLTVFFQTAPGVFDPAPSLTLGGPATTDGAVSVAAADVDGDGDLDLVSANVLAGTLTVFFQTAPGVFDPVPALTLDSPPGSEFPASVTTADLDGDGNLDLLSSNPGGSLFAGVLNNTLTVFFQTGAGVFESETLSLPDPPTTVSDAVASVTVADVDGDGDLDILSGGGNGANLSVFYGTHEP